MYKMNYFREIMRKSRN